MPQDLDQAFRLATALAASGLAPRGMDKPEQVMVAIMAGAELGLAPFQAIQSFAVVNGRPTLWGDGLMAVVRARGVKVREWLTGEGDGMAAHCHVTRPDTGEEIERAYLVADAKKANLWGKQGPWQQHPKRMLQMRARAFALRDGCADMLRGVQMREEVEDYQQIRDVTPKPSGLRDRLAGPQKEGFSAAQAEHQALPDPVDFVESAEAVEAIVEEIEAEPDLVDQQMADDTAPAPVDDDFPGDRPPTTHFDVLAWADDMEAKLPAYVDVDLLRFDWNERKHELDARDPLRCKALNQAIARRAAEIGAASK